MKGRKVPLLIVGLLALMLTSCDGDGCPPGIASCLPYLAVRISVSAAPGGGPVENVTVQVRGVALGQNACTVQANATICDVPGPDGTYALVVGAPGFQSVQRDVIVRGTEGQCGCRIVTTENVSMVLARIP